MTDHITLPRSVVEQAIEALKKSIDNFAANVQHTAAAENLRAALAGAAQAEPVAHGFGPTLMAQHSAFTAPQPAQPVAVPQGWRDFLKKIEWENHAYNELGDGEPFCVCCGRWKSEGHKSDCEFVAMLAAAPTPPAATVLEPLTIEQINALPEVKKVNWPMGLVEPIMRVIRAVEAVHAAKLAKLNGITPPAEGGV